MRITRGRKFWNVRIVLKSISAKRNAHNGEQRESDLQIGVCHHWITVLFEIEPLGIVKAGIVVHA